MPQQGSNPRASILLAEEYFGAEDDRFLPTLRQVASPKALAGIVDRWKRDPRPWARRQILAYLAEPLDCPGHNVVVKRLFKQAEQQGDDELLARFLVAFDVLVRHVRVRRYRYDWQANASWEEESLHLPRNAIPPSEPRVYRNPRTGEEVAVPGRVSRNGRLFSYRTRYYLRRRAWRYFRRMGFQRPGAYVPAIARALAAYQDEWLAKGEDILDSWGLMQACFCGCDALEFGPSRVRLKEGRKLGELTPGPRFAGLWRKAEALPVLIALAARAQARLVRVWAMQMLKREHAARLAEIPADEIMMLLDHEDEEIQQFAAELLQGSGQLARLPVATWLQLLSARSLTALELVCDAMRKHVTADRIGLDECLRLACAEAAPAARLGLDFLREKPFDAPQDRAALASVANARCAAVAGQTAAWALGILGGPEHYDRDVVLRFFDALLRPTRRAAWEWVVRGDSPGHNDPALWCRLLETPYDDLRLPLVDELQRRASLPGAGVDDLSPLWCTVLLGVHRGGRQKAKALRQMADAIRKDPGRAPALLPVLGAAVRSVRPAEARAGLAAVVGVAAAHPEVADAVRQLLPELQWATTP